MSLFLEATTGAAALAAIYGGWERSQWCTSQWMGPTLAHGPAPRELALTFDDGPNDRCTGEILEKLAKADVRATFFFVGDHARALPWIAKAVADAGHVVGNHTMTHVNLAYRSAATIRQEIGDCNALLEDVTGKPVRFFRPPFGGRRPAVLRIARELGLQPVQWNSMGFDWREHRTAKQIVKSIESDIRANRKAGRGTCILLHDGAPSDALADRSRSVSAAGSLLERGHAAGYRFVTVEDWWGKQPEAPMTASFPLQKSVEDATQI